MSASSFPEQSSFSAAPAEILALNVIIVLNNKEAPMHDTSFHVLVRHCGVRAL